MKKKFKTPLLFALLSSSIYAEQITENLRLDAYANIQTNINEKEDSFQLSGGLQTRYQINHNLSATAQLYISEGENDKEMHSNSLKNYNVEIKWLYLAYYLGYDFSVRVGKFQFPVFKSSETGTIGYTYTSTTTPLNYYGAFGCNDFKGLELLKRFTLGELDILTQLSIGKSENELYGKDNSTLTGTVNSLSALTLKTSNDFMLLNIGYLEAKSDLDHLNISSVNIKMHALETEIYNDTFTLKAGIIQSKLSYIFPDELRYYSSLEYNYEQFTPYILYSNEIFDYTDTEKIKAPTSDQERSFIKKYSIGTRYDLDTNIALKLSYTHTINLYENTNNTIQENDDTIIGTINVIF